jgi:hypothetical protein
MQLAEFLNKLNTTPTEVTFADTMAVIEANYTFTPTAFKNAGLKNEADQNNGSCKIFAFGLLNRLTELQILNCFGDYYRQDVVENPDGDDHQNIRNFLKKGLQGITFESNALAAK